MCTFCFYCSGGYPDLHSFPTRRSSDLWLQAVEELEGIFDLVVDVAQDRDVDRAARKHRIARASEDELHGPDLLSLEPLSELAEVLGLDVLGVHRGASAQTAGGAHRVVAGSGANVRNPGARRDPE